MLSAKLKHGSHFNVEICLSRSVVYFMKIALIGLGGGGGGGKKKKGFGYFCITMLCFLNAVGAKIVKFSPIL